MDLTWLILILLAIYVISVLILVLNKKTTPVEKVLLIILSCFFPVVGLIISLVYISRKYTSRNRNTNLRV